MGIKALKREFKIGHIVQRLPGKIVIGSPYVSELIAIHSEGIVSKSRSVQSGKDEIGQIYDALIGCDKAKLLKILNDPEIPIDPKPVYTEATRGRVIKVYCEEYGWPNLTTEGVLMYDNIHFKRRSEALKDSKEDRVCGIKWTCKALWKDCRELLGKTKRLFFEILCLIRLYVFRGY